MAIPAGVYGRDIALRFARRPYQIPKLVIGICIVAVAARLILINQPYVDHWSWRQSDVAAIARNFLENGFHFAYPQIDWAGDATGYVGTEFPILPFLAAICYKFAGVHEWIGRSQAVIFFAFSGRAGNLAIASNKNHQHRYRRTASVFSCSRDR